MWISTRYVDEGDGQILHPEGDWTPWGSPMLADVCGRNVVVQAWRRDAAAKRKAKVGGAKQKRRGEIPDEWEDDL